MKTIPVRFPQETKKKRKNRLMPNQHQSQNRTSTCEAGGNIKREEKKTDTLDASLKDEKCSIQSSDS
jgi:hypothetical protein